MPLANEVQQFNRSVKAGGDLIATRHLIDSTQIGLVAGTTQTQAGAVVGTDALIVVATTANANDGLQLPKVKEAGKYLTVTNDGAQNLKIWPWPLDTINNGAADAADAGVLATTKSRQYRSTTALNWERVVFE